MQVQKRISRFFSKNALSVAQRALVMNRCLISRETAIFVKKRRASVKRRYGIAQKAAFLQLEFRFHPFGSGFEFNVLSPLLGKHAPLPEKQRKFRALD